MIWRDGKRIYIHRWVMEQMLGRKLRPDEDVLHTCDNPSCYLYEHLFLGTQADNMADMIAKGRARHDNNPKGSKHWSAKLNENDVVRIKNLLRQGKTAYEIGRLFGVTGENILFIKSGKTWKHVTARFVRNGTICPN
jgi:hypothetical protein